MKLEALIEQMLSCEGSDLYLSVGAPPSVKTQGNLEALNDQALSESDVLAFLAEMASSKDLSDFEQRKEMNVAFENNQARFRLNAFYQRSHPGCVLRHIKTDIPTPESLAIPEVCKELVMQKRGLVLFTGSTGSGKSTSMASLIDYRNKNSKGHIVLIEDPVEFIHPHQGCIITQREVGSDTNTYADALKNTLRQAPDVIVIGEIRDAKTMEYAISFAETGHLCISTLHANNANQALDRIINFFPQDKRDQLLMDLSLNLRGIVSQRLIPSLDNKRALCAEVLLSSAHIADLIKQGEITKIKAAMSQVETSGMQTFDQALEQLVVAGKITIEEALANADSENNLKIALKKGGKPDEQSNLSIK